MVMYYFLNLMTFLNLRFNLVCSLYRQLTETQYKLDSVKIKIDIHTSFFPVEAQNSNLPEIRLKI